MNHSLVIARSGGGKTSSYILPNIFNLAQNGSSMVVTDISGEIFRLTSGYLKSKGYEITVLQPDSLSNSSGYNPLEYAKDSASIDELCEILIASSTNGNTDGNQKVWTDGAKNLISILMRALINTNQKDLINLGNVRYLLSYFGTKELADFILTYGDAKTLNEFKSFMRGNQNTILSYVASANTALAPIGINNNLEILTSKNEIDFSNLRTKKSIIYVVIPAHKQSQYSFLVNTFYSQLFSNLMTKIPSKNERSVYCLLDEFGNLNLGSNFSSIVTTARQYRISISMIVQDVSQLYNRYGEYGANSIMFGGVSSKLYFNGLDVRTAQSLEESFGEKERLDIYDGATHKENVPVMRASEIIQMSDKEILYVYSNLPPIKLKVTPYFKHSQFKRWSKKSVANISSNLHSAAMHYVQL
jgi:type IV secretory pathway TraG/TraD family ATPase VirD4